MESANISGLLVRQAFCREQYHLVRGSRMELLNYCGQIDPVLFVSENTTFGRGGSMRNLLVHIANCYEFWIGLLALKRELNETAFSSANNIAAIRPVFDRVDSLVFDFLDEMADAADTEITYKINGNSGTASRFKLFTHVITHEFHHKGQLLSLSRLLGYTPVDTDIMR